MDKTSERVLRVKREARRLTQKREKRAIRRLRARCVLLALCLIGSLAYFTGGAAGAVQGLHGATLLSDSAGGYVLVAVAAFSAAVALTLACTRLREREKENREKKENEAI